MDKPAVPWFYYRKVIFLQKSLSRTFFLLFLLTLIGLRLIYLYNILK
ncbi:hypothetical protein IX321_000965 [Bacteroides pyogenes]|nr:hypothetical protein [Bacteroides pyogenes]MBR8717246.1 hypothetical protein [Bacteroides pyogenes]MBR8746552.1 hypothetical protein [Bacteroides pyogenes]MBR8756824.1 hypothetical protein [Bacteroides pyogenes]MBR8779994.1 hypothetical protein [Bacteroides pyogenes]